MAFLSMRVFSFLLLFGCSHSATFTADGVSWWKSPHVQIGDSVVFQHGYNYSLYIFKNQRAFSLCNFTQATLLTKPDSSSYTWHVSRPGFFYFSFNNGSSAACLEGEKFAMEVHTAAQPPVSGNTVASSPSFPWPFQPKERSPGPSPLSATTPTPSAADREGIPFISSNPAVPLPTGEVDSATIRPMPTTSNQNPQQVVGFPNLIGVMISAILVMMMV